MTGLHTAGLTETTGLHTANPTYRNDWTAHSESNIYK